MFYENVTAVNYLPMTIQMTENNENFYPENKCGLAYQSLPD